VIWPKKYSLNEINEFNKNCLVDHLEIQISAIDSSGLEATMPVKTFNQQPFGLLHGGASCSLAETLGSIAANLVLLGQDQVAVGQSLTANYLKPATNGIVTGRTEPIHIGKKSQVWSIEIKDENERLLSNFTLTVAIIPHLTL